jgi:pilus assembly protein CpaB
LKNKLALVVAVVLGLIAMYGFLRYWQSQKTQYEEQFKTVAVVAAKQRIQAGTEIRTGMLATIPMPASAVSPDNILKGDETRLLGQTIVRSVERDEPLLNSYFRRPVEKLRDRLTQGERAVTVRVDAISGVGGNLVPGSRVDIIGTFPAAAALQGARPAPTAPGASTDLTVALLSNVSVLAVDSQTREMEYLAGGGPRGAQAYGTVTLAVTPEEAVLLIFAQQYGALTFTLRPDADTTFTDTRVQVGDGNLLQKAEQAQNERRKRLEKRAPMEIVR